MTANGWTVQEGVVTTTNGSTSDMHLQMREYASPTGFPNAIFSVGEVFNKVKFNAFTNQTSGFSIIVRFSTDNITYSTGTTFSLSTSDNSYTAYSDISNPLYVMFQMYHEVEPNTQRVTIDDVIIENFYKGNVQDVIFNENNGIINNQIVADGQTVSSYTPNRTGYSFDNWYEASDFSGSPYNFSTPVVASLNLYAKWAINQYTKSFDSNGRSSVTAITQASNT